MLAVKVIKPFTRKGALITPGTVLDIPDDILPKLAGMVEPVKRAEKVVPLRRIWFENGELRIVGVYDDLAKEIISLTKDDLPMQRRLLMEHCQQFGPAHIGRLFEAWEERAAIMEHDAGMTREQAEAEAAKGYHLTAWLDELRVNQIQPLTISKE